MDASASDAAVIDRQRVCRVVPVATIEGPAVLSRRREVMPAYPRLAVVATTLREVRSTTANDWSAVCRTPDGFRVGPACEGLEILDRVGGGDSFASGLFYELLNGWDIEKALAYAVAHGALAMTTPGDTSMATLAEVERLVAGGSARAQR